MESNIILTRLSTGTRDRNGYCHRAQRGVSAIEFALIAPVMVLMLFGSIEISQAISVDRKVTVAASTLGDLAAQTDKVSCADLKQMAGITKSVFAPYTASNPSFVVAALVLSNGVPTVEWSQSIDETGGCTAVPTGHALKVGNSVAVDTALFAPNGSLVVGEVSIQYISLGTSFVPATRTMTDRLYFRPRKSAKLCLIGFSAPGCA
jgi:Flp pilus assembly protein TadG